jgi:hypothetical protein
MPMNEKERRRLLMRLMMKETKRVKQKAQPESSFFISVDECGDIDKDAGVEFYSGNEHACTH